MEITRDGYEKIQQSITITPGQTVPLEVVLAPSATVSVAAVDSADASAVTGVVYLDGRPLGSSPLANLHAEPGPHEVRVEADGYEPGKQIINVVAGQPLPLTLHLDQQKGTLAISTLPVQGQIYVDGKLLEGAASSDGAREISLAPGAHDVEARALGYTPGVVKAVVTAHERKDVALRMQSLAEHARDLLLKLQYNQAADAARQAEDFNQDDALARAVLANALLYRDGDSPAIQKQAGAEFKEAFRIMGKTPDPHAWALAKNAQGMLFASRRPERDKAVPAFEEALRSDPTLLVVYRSIGIYFANQKDWARAAETYHKATLLAPNQGQYALWLADALGERNDLNDARQALDQAKAAGFPDTADNRDIVKALQEATTVKDAAAPPASDAQ